MKDETKESYVKMFQSFRKRFPGIFILGDRSHAFEDVYKDQGHYFYCCRHLLANIYINAKHF